MITISLLLGVATARESSASNTGSALVARVLVLVGAGYDSIKQKTGGFVQHI